MRTIQITPGEVEIGMHIVVDPKPKDPHQQENPFYYFEDLYMTVEEVMPLPNGAFYFIYGGFERNSIYIKPTTRIEISLKELLKRL